MLTPLPLLLQREAERSKLAKIPGMLHPNEVAEDGMAEAD